MSEILRVELAVAPERRVAINARFELGAGVNVLFGPSGVGKTTVLLAIAGLFTPDSGRVVLGDRVLFDSAMGIDLPPEQRGTALVFQSLALFPHMTAVENVAYGLSRAQSRNDRKRRAGEWLERMRVAHLHGRRPATFSGGEAQRVALARALASEPRLLLLDEPFSAMDEGLRVELGRELSRLLSEVAIPVLLVTHDKSDVARLAARVLAMENGQVNAAIC